MIKVSVYGAKELAQYIKELPDAAGRVASEAAAETFRKILTTEKKKPGIPGIYPWRITRYRRTNKLRNSWRSYPRGAYTSVKSEGVPYAGYVMGGLSSAIHQAQVHKGWWLTVDDVLDRYAGDALGDAEKAVQRMMDESAGKPGILQSVAAWVRGLFSR